MHKRNGLERIGLALMMSATMILAGCSTDWVQEAEQIVAVMIPGAANLVTLIAMLEGKTVTAEDLAVVQSAGTQAGSDLQLIQSLIAAYDKADATAKQGCEPDSERAECRASESGRSAAGELHIKDAATQTKLTAVVGILLFRGAISGGGGSNWGSGIRSQRPGVSRGPSLDSFGGCRGQCRR